MRTRRHAILTFFGLILPLQVGAVASTPPPAVLAVVTQELEVGGSDTRLAPRLLKPVRIGKEVAWQANFEKAGAIDWCGSGGCRVVLYAEVKRNWQPVFDHQVRQFRLKGDRLTVELYGKFCGKAGNAACMARHRWDAVRHAWKPMDKAPPPLDSMIEMEKP